MPIDGGGAAVAAAVDDMGCGDGMQCTDHPYRKNTPGGICAFCLQEKLGKLVSSSSSSFIRSSTSSSSPSFRSEQLPTLRLTPCSTAAAAASAATSSNVGDVSNGGFRRGYEGHVEGACKVVNGSSRRARIPFLLTQKKNKKSSMITAVASSSSSADTNNNNNALLKRCKSTATPRSTRYLSSDSHDLSPRRRGFWSFLQLSSSSSHKKPEKPKSIAPPTAEYTAAAVAEQNHHQHQQQQQAVVVVVDEGGDSSPNSSGSNATSFGRKVSRSRSVGCGSRSFSGDFFERISTGFGDCTLRRVESQREGRRSTSAARAAGDAIKGRVPCGGLFGGFVITSSSSSSSWVSSADDGNGRAATPGTLVNGRNRNWAWAFASPRRAFGKTTSTPMSKDGRRDIGVGIEGVSKNSSSNANGTTPNLAAIPSLLAVRGCAVAGE